MRRILLIILSLAFSYSCIAQKNMQDSVEYMDVLYYDWNPNNTHVQQYKNKQVITVDSNYWKAVAVENPDQILRAISGVDVKQRGASGVQIDVGIDGGGFDQTMLLVNGLKLIDPQTGHNMMMMPLEWSMIRQIQVLKGPASSMYGVNALAGTINFITASPQTNYLTGRMTVGSSFQRNEFDNLYNNTGIVVQGGLTTGKFYHQLQTGWKKSNGFKKNTAYNSPNIWYQVEGNLGKHTMQAMAGYRYMDFGANGFYAAPGDSNSHETVQNTVVGLKHAVPLTKHLVWHNDLVYLYKTDDYKYIKSPVIGRNIHYQNIFNFTSLLRYKSRYGNVKLAMEWRTEALNSTNLGAINRNNVGSFINYDYLLLGKLSFEAGLYFNHNSQYGTQLYPNIGLGYFISPNSKILANYGTGQRLPTFTDLFYNQRGVIEGNANLLSEQAWNVEVGYQYIGVNKQLTSYVFYRAIDQFIDWTRNNQYDVWRPNNYHQLNTLGVNISWQQQIELSNIWTLGYIASYNYLHPTIALISNDIISRYAINSLRHQGVLGVFAEYKHRLKFQFAANLYERISYKKYALYNASINYKINKLSLGLRVSNLTNAVVQEAGANTLPGRWLQANLQYDVF